MRVQTTFLREAAVGAVLSLAAGLVVAALDSHVADATAVRTAVAALGFVTVARMLFAAREQTGGLVCLALLAALTGTLWLVGVGLGVFVVAQVVALWSVRALYVHARRNESVLDAVLLVLALGFAGWAYAEVASVAAASWCFFLVAALHVELADAMARLGRTRAPAPHETAAHRAFAGALDAAEEALRRLEARRRMTPLTRRRR